ncbi:MAG: SOS response-associated peptidase [Ilumatobacteraceae bacterium]
MCGRFVSTNSAEDVANYFGASFEPPADGGPELPSNFNVAPTNDVLAVVADGSADSGDVRMAVRAFHWGLVPIWAKDAKIGSSMINARSETVADKPAFKGVFKRYRCIIPMDGFYEWQAAPVVAEGSTSQGPVGKNGKPVKQPMFIHRVDGEPLAVAGLWSAWRDKNGPADAPWLHTCTVITTAANNTMAPVHDRMPVILPASAWQQWLDPATDDVEALKQLLVPAPDNLLTMHKVSTEVNNVRNRGPELIEAV